MTRDEPVASLLARALLAPPGVVYGALVRMRNRLYDAGLLPVRRLPCPVVSIGNLSVGGTGKTPLVSFLGTAITDAGYRVGIVSRGYRRAGGSEPLVVSDGRRLLALPEEAGDEPWLLARDNVLAAVAVGADRFAAAKRLLGTFRAEVILLDDGFQHRRLGRDLDLLLVPARAPFGNGRILPFGPLREPLHGVARADAVVVTRGDGRCPEPLRAILERHNPRAPVFHASFVPSRFVPAAGDPVDLVALKGFTAFAFSGIARPERFEEDLAAAGVRLAGTRRFADHHPYRGSDLEAVAREARALRAEVLVTTEKDMVRIPAMPENAPPLFALRLQVRLEGERDPLAWILDRLRDRLEPAAGRASGAGR